MGPIVFPETSIFNYQCTVTCQGNENLIIGLVNWLHVSLNQSDPGLNIEKCIVCE